MKLTLDLHDVYNRGADIDRALRAVMDEAVSKKAPLVEIIPGKGSGALKKRVLRFLDQKENRALYHRVEKDVDNHGRIFVHFRWKGPCPTRPVRRRLTGRPREPCPPNRDQTVWVPAPTGMVPTVLAVPGPFG